MDFLSGVQGSRGVAEPGVDLAGFTKSVAGGVAKEDDAASAGRWLRGCGPQLPRHQLTSRAVLAAWPKGCREVSPEVGVGGEPGLLQCREPGQQAIEHAEHHGAMEPCGHSRSARPGPVEALLSCGTGSLHLCLRQPDHQEPSEMDARLRAASGRCAPPRMSLEQLFALCKELKRLWRKEFWA